MAAVSTATTEVRFGRLQFATTRATAAPSETASRRPSCAPCHLALTLAAVSAELVWCPASSAVLTAPHVPAARVAGLVRAGRLWVSSGGRAIELVMQVQVTDDGRAEAEAKRKRKKRPPPRPPPLHFLDRLADAVTGWRGWGDELGLSVRRHDGDDAGEASDVAASSTLRFLVSKPATPDGLCAPPVPASYSRNGADGEGSAKAGVGIPQAQLRRVVCQLVYDALPAEVVSATTAAETAARLGGKKRKTAAKACRTTGGGATTRQPSRQQSIRSRRGIAPPTVCAAQLLAAEGLDEKDGDAPDSASLWPGAVALVEAVLSTLVGVRRRVLGVRPVSWTTVASAGGCRPPVGCAAANGSSRLLASSVSSSPYTSLLDIAPSVWNAHYGQAVAARAALIPTLCRLLATSGTSAQAPSLRRKASAMGRRNAASMVATIETRLHELVLKEAPVLPSRRAARRRCAARRRGSNVVGKSGNNSSGKCVGNRKGPGDHDISAATLKNWRSVGEAMRDDRAAYHLALRPTPPPDDSHESAFYNICMDNLDAIFTPSEDGESENDDSGEDQGANWKEIEAWSELDEWPADHGSDYEPGWNDEDDGDGYEEGNRPWLPSPHREGAYKAFGDEEEGLIDDDDSNDIDGYRDEEEGTGCADWQEVEDWQLEAWAASSSVPHHGMMYRGTEF